MLHLIHPALVHFSVAFLVFGGVCEVWGLARDRDAFTRLGATLVLMGTVSLLPAIFSGYLAANTVEIGEPTGELLAAHERNGWIVLGMFVLAQFWKGWTGGRLPRRQRPLYAAFLVAAVLVTGYSALSGGEMVYFHAVGVAP